MVASPGRSARFSDLRGHRQRSPNSAALTVGRLASLSPGCAGRGSERSAEFGSVTHTRCPLATANQPPLLKLFYKESDSNERLRVSNWIVQRLYDDAVKKTVEL
jgi:hypothetical protein